jgi:3-methyladenine DNA glycosylase/8-oxoguanine DNA glycosylase
MTVSKEFVNRKLSANLYELEREKNFQQIKNELVELPGVGPHVIESYFAMRGLKP